MKSNTITINLNYNEEDVQLDVNELIDVINSLLKEKYKNSNLAYEIKDTSITTISIPGKTYPINPCPNSPNEPWYDPSPFRYDKVVDPPQWWKNVPQCTITPNCPQYATPITMNTNNNKKGNN